MSPMSEPTDIDWLLPVRDGLTLLVCCWSAEALAVAGTTVEEGLFFLHSAKKGERNTKRETKLVSECDQQTSIIYV